MWAMSSTLKNLTYIVALLSFIFVTKTRSGKGSLHVMMAGSGKRPSRVIFGGPPVLDLLEVDHGRKRPGLGPPSTFGANWYWTRAYDSRRFGGARGGSIGKKLKRACYDIVSRKHSLFQMKNLA